MYSESATRRHGAAGDSKYEAAAALAARKFGVDLAKYPRASVERLLDGLPDKVTEQDLGALNRIVSACSIGETMFMRHPEQFLALERLVPTLNAARERRPLRVWSAGCATGEEAYSLAAVLANYAWGLEVVGTDVNPAAIERGCAGRYRLWSMRSVDPQAVSSWLDVNGLEVTVRAASRSRVALSVQNLVTDACPRDVDIIFCRNVFLYFHEHAVKVVLNRFHDSLRPDGLLFLGYFDPVPSDGARWVQQSLGSVGYFRKAGGIAVPSLERAPLAKPAPLATPGGCGASEPASTAVAANDSCGRFEAALSLARALCGQGASLEALRLLSELNRDFPLEIEPYVLAAMIAEESGAFETALQAARRAHFLAPTEPTPQYLFGICLDRAGEPARAELHLRHARRALERTPDLRLPLRYGEGMTGLQLRRMIDVRLDDTK